MADPWLDVAAALTALGDAAGGPIRRFLGTYDFETLRLEITR